MLASHGSMQWRFHPLGDAFAVLAFAAFINKVSFKHRGRNRLPDKGCLGWSVLTIISLLFCITLQ